MVRFLNNTRCACPAAQDPVFVKSRSQCATLCLQAETCAAFGVSGVTPYIECRITTLGKTPPTSTFELFPHMKWFTLV